MGLQNIRAEGYENWFKVVCSINNISKSNSYEEEGHILIHQFSQKSAADYDANDVNKKLSKLLPKPKGQGPGFGTIKHLLKEDNLELYQQLFNTRDQLVIAISNGGQHLDIAEVFSSLFPGEFVWATTTKDTLFYRFTSTVWERQEDDATVCSTSCLKRSLKLLRTCQHPSRYKLKESRTWPSRSSKRKRLQRLAKLLVTFGACLTADKCMLPS